MLSDSVKQLGLGLSVAMAAAGFGPTSARVHAQEIDPVAQRIETAREPDRVQLSGREQLVGPLRSIELRDGRLIGAEGQEVAIADLVAKIEPSLRGETLLFAVLDKNGAVQQVKEIEFPKEEEMNAAMVWGLFATGLLASATLSGLSIGLFSVSKLQLTLLAEHGDRDAEKILGLRQDSNTVLSTLIWGNVGLNVLLSHIGDHAVSQTLGTIGGMLFSIGAITLFGEILPQSYFTQNVLKVGARLEPLVQGLRVLLYPVAKPSGMLMDRLVGQEGVQYFNEKELETLLRLSSKEEGGQTSHVEATGAINFLTLDDLTVTQEGEAISPESIIQVPFDGDKPILPSISIDASDPFLRSIRDSAMKWVILCDQAGIPRLVLDADSYLRDVLFEPEHTPLHSYWHKPVVVRDDHVTIGEVVSELKVRAEHHEDDVIDNDLIIVWTSDHRRIITGSDLLGRLLRGIVQREIEKPLLGTGTVVSAPVVAATPEFSSGAGGADPSINVPGCSA